MPATPDQVRKVMQSYVQAWTTGDRKLFISLFAKDARWADPVPRIAGRFHFRLPMNWNITSRLCGLRRCSMR